MEGLSQEKVYLNHLHVIHCNNYRLLIRKIRHVHFQINTLLNVVEKWLKARLGVHIDSFKLRRD
jgi:hypothetical protein